VTTPGGGQAAAAAAAAQAARQGYGRLLAWLAWQWRDIAAGEDALAEAFASALQTWPRDGVPASPEGWLLTAAKRQLLMAARRQRLADDPALTILWPGEHEPAPEAPALPDQRLRLLFVCAHPAIDPTMHAALMLQTVLGLEAGRIASAFLVKPEAMTKRLVRAKAKIKATGIRFEEPGVDELPGRVQAVLEAIYGAYVLHWDAAPDDPAGDLAGEAVFLAGLVAAHLRDDAPPAARAEALGLLALLWLCEARRPARLDAQGEFVPLERQDASAWDADLIGRADHALARAAALLAPGPFQLEAAIQAAHVERAQTGVVPWPAIVRLYQALLDAAPTVGAQIGHAVASARAAGRAAPGLALLDAIDPARVASHQPWWAARAHLLAQDGLVAEAATAYGRALALTTDPALRRYLAAQLDACLSAAGTSAAPARSPETRSAAPAPPAATPGTATRP
jgi:RNA polymerase sigma-70 factor, ECF subfamily